MFNFETALATWRHQYKYSSAFKGRDLDELEQHIRDQVDYLVDQGETPEAAFRITIKELGTFHELESDFQRVAWNKTKDRKEVLSVIRANLAMMASYFIVAFRNLKKNRASSIINMLGMSASIAVSLVAFLFVSAQFTADTFHDNADEIFLVHQITQEEYGEQWWGYAPRPLGPALDTLSPQVVRSVRIHQRRGVVKYGDVDLNQSIRFVDPEFFDMFDFPLSDGLASAAQKEGEILLSASSKQRFFGDDDAIGKTILLQFDNEAPVAVTVTGVAEEFPENAGLQFNAVMSWNSLEKMVGSSPDDWSLNAMATFVQLDDARSSATVTTQLNQFKDRINAVSEDWVVSGLALDNLTQLSKNRDRVEQSIANNIPWAPVIVLSAISLLLLLLSSFNYMNITIATSTKRLREIGVRKVVGGKRHQIIFQFLAENIILSGLALVGGFWFAWQFVLPGFISISGIPMTFRLLTDGNLWMFMVALILGIGFVSGAYPAFYITSFRPSSIFRGNQQLGRRRPITQLLLVFQFLLTFLTVLSGIVFSLNGRYHAQQDWGFDGDNIVVFHVDSESEYQAIAQAASSIPDVLQIEGTEDVVGRPGYDHDVRFNLEEVEGPYFGVTNSYLGMMQLEVAMGSMLGDSLSSPGSEGIMINEAFATAFELENSIGEFVEIDSVSYSIVGVLTDFHYRDFFSQIQPAVFVKVVPDDVKFVSIKFQPGTGAAVAQQVSDQFESVFPTTKAVFHFHDDEVQEFVEESSGLTHIFMFVALISLFISCLSIYALSAQNVINRMKEVGIRKVLGSRSYPIAQHVNRRLIWLLTIAAVASTPLGYYMLLTVLDDIYAFHMPLTYVPFLFTYLVVVATALLTITTQVRRIEKARPADILRSE